MVKIMKEIKIKTNKKLKLINCIECGFDPTQGVQQNKIRQQMVNYIKRKGLNQVGPFITFSKLEVDNTQMTLLSKFLLQVDQNGIQIEEPYKFTSEIFIENCIMAEFYDYANYMQLAYQKISVYAYEHELKLRGDKYTVFLKESEHILVHIFMPILN